MWTHKYKEYGLNEHHVANIEKLWDTNLIVYGPSDSGKKTVLEKVLRRKCNNFNAKFMLKTFEVVTIDLHKKIEQSMYFRQNDNIYEFCFQESNMDKYILRDVIKDYASKFYIRNLIPMFKVIVLYNIDSLSIDAVTMLNTIISKSVQTCRFILVTSSYSKIPDKVKNNCLQYKIIRPNTEELVNVLTMISNDEKMTVSQDLLAEACNKNDNKISECVTWLQFLKYDIKSSLCTVLNRVYDKITANDKLINIREDLYVLLINNIPSKYIVKELCKRFVQNDVKSKDIVHISAVYEHRILFEERSIYHLEVYVYQLLTAIHNDSNCVHMKTPLPF